MPPVEYKALNWRHPIVKLDALATQRKGLRQFGQVAKYLAPVFSSGLLASFYLATPGALTSSGLAFYALLGAVLGLTSTRGIVKSLRIAEAERKSAEKSENLLLAAKQIADLQKTRSSLLDKLREAGVSESELVEAPFDGHNVFKKMLGQGGMAIAVLVKNLDLGGKLQVLKIPRPALLGEPMALARFKGGEAATMVELNHPNVVRFFDLLNVSRTNYLEMLRLSQVEEYESLKAVADSIPEEVPCIKMEFVQGPTLESVLTQKNHLDLATTVKLAGDIAKTLQYVGRRNVIHRDLKPDNIFIISDEDLPGAWTVKIVDFGLAKQVSQTPKKSAMTMVGAVMGTPYYMSPEQWVGASDIDWRTDQYALGVIMFQMLSGELPFRGGTELAAQGGQNSLATKIIGEPPPDIRMLVDNVPDRLIQTVEKMLAKRKEDRFASWDAVLDALDQSLPRSLTRA